MTQSGTPGPTVGGRAVWSLIRASRKLEGAVTDVLAAHDLTATQFAILAQLDETPSLVQSDLARATCEQHRSVGSLLRGLEGRDLITRLSVRGQGNRQTFSLTPRGQELLRAAKSASRPAGDLRRYGLSPLDVTLLNEALQTILAHR